MTPFDNAQLHLSKAREFLEAAEANRDMELNNAATSDAVISAINSKDAICLALTGRTNKGETHDEAVSELRRLVPRVGPGPDTEPTLEAEDEVPIHPGLGHAVRCRPSGAMGSTADDRRRRCLRRPLSVSRGGTPCLNASSEPSRGCVSQSQPSRRTLDGPRQLDLPLIHLERRRQLCGRIAADPDVEG